MIDGSWPALLARNTPAASCHTCAVPPCTCTALLHSAPHDAAPARSHAGMRSSSRSSSSSSSSSSS
eukprot:8631345-Heterocapsa_arctica.AAC.1